MFLILGEVYNKIMKILMGRVISKKQAGVTSLLLVLAIGLILTIMVAGISALSIREQQQARKTDLSSRALQAAEAGIKLASAKLSIDPTYSKLTCAPIAGDTTFRPPNTPSGESPLGLNTEITCATVTSVFSDAYEGYLSQDRAFQAFAEPLPRYVSLSWHTRQDGELDSYAYTGTLYPLATGYNSAASIEITVIYWPKTEIGIGDIESHTIFLVPGTTKVLRGETVKNTCPLNTTTYKCSTKVIDEGQPYGFDVRKVLQIDGPEFNDYNMAIRIKPRYRDTHFSLSLHKSDGTNISMQSTSAQIDITARVDNLYRRVRAEKLISQVAVENILDSVVYTGRGNNDTGNFAICKKMIIRVSDNVLAPTSPPC